MQSMDSQIRHAVVQELKWDTRVDAAALTVAVTDRVVTLSGSVGSWAQRLAAQRATHRVKGVGDIANDIRVKLEGSALRTDGDVLRAVRQALAWNVFVPAQRLCPSVHKGWVRLEGEVDNGGQRAEAERSISHLAGVCGVTNKIEVRAVKVTTLNVRRALTEALQRRGAAPTSAIYFDVEQGRVRLRGVVCSWPERAAAVAAARKTLGVREVEDQLSVLPNS